MGEKQRVSGSTEIAASPETVYALVTDLPRMGEWSPENTGGQWVGNAEGPAVGARFKGSNVQGKKKWNTTMTVSDATSPTRFAFTNKVAGITFAEWIYEIEPTGSGCTITETWVDHRGAVARTLGKSVTGIDDRAAHTKTMIDTTLSKLKQTAESGG